MKYSDDVRNAKLDAVEATVGDVGAVLKIFDGTRPANCAAADAGTVLVTIALPNPWMSAAASGSKAKTGTWQDLSADNTGTAQYFRIYSSGGACKIQGSCGLSAADMILDSVSFTAGQQFSITGFQLVDNNG